MLRSAFFLLGLLQAAAGVSTQRSPLPTQSGLMEITERGRMLAEYDAAAWHSADAVKALKAEKSEEGKGGRYMARKVDGKWEVVYGHLNGARDKFLIAYEATTAETPEQFNVRKYDPPHEDDGFYLSGARAIETALAVFTGEKRPYNTAVLPAKSGQVYVYIYPARTEADVYVLGGDVRYLISADGSTIEETRRLHKTILEFKDSITSGQAKKGSKAEMGYHNHILDDVPEDTDVFYAMTRKPSVPEVIITWEYTYMVLPDGTIKYEGESANLFGKKNKTPSRVPAQRSPLPTNGELAEISQRGRMLAEYDAASWHSRSAVLALQPEPGTVERHVARKVDNGWVVAYGRLSEPRDKFLITYEAVSAVNPDQFTVKKFDPPREDKEFYLSGAKAIETGRSVFVGEKRPYNDAVLPTKSGQLYVYIYPAQTHADVYPIGGDVRYLVSPDGSTIQGTRQLHIAIIDSEDPVKSGQVEEGYRQYMSVHTHVLDDVPEDTDVFSAMMRKPPIPEMIVSSEYTYVVFPDGSVTYKGKSAKLFGKKKLAALLADGGVPRD